MSIDSQKQEMAQLLTNNQELLPLLFDKNKKLYNYERQTLLNIIDFVKEKTLKILPTVQIKDAILCGGSTSYIYNDKTDIDIALILDIDEKIMPKEEFQRFLGKVNKGLALSGYRFKIIKRNIDYGLINYIRPGFGVYSIWENKWISEPIHREFSYSIDEFYEAYYQYSENIHQHIATFPMLNRDFFTPKGCEQLREYLFQIKEDALNAKLNNQEKEYCMEYNFYRCAKLFGVIPHFNKLINDSYKFYINNQEPKHGDAS